MNAPGLRSNPYVGLRPFFQRDSLYFFGRGQQTAELLEILHQQRFLGVVGSSGSGKSSLVRAGLLPKLLGGFLAQERDRWRIVQLKPGDSPIGNLATALLEAMDQPSGPEARSALEARIRDDHTDAVVELLQARVEPNANVFLLVDQFEEIFAFRGTQQQEDEGSAIADAARWKERARRKAEAADFVDLLLALAERRDMPIYVALTMRTDFLGDCDLFYGLPEALNRGRYLVPRLTRQQLREAIEGPAMLLRARIEPRLLDHLLNELGDRFDRLPVLQHALLRTWDTWQRAGGIGPIDFQHYEAAGTLARALDRDAERALSGLDLGVTAAVFKRLTDTDARQRRVRSPARISELMAVASADRATVEGIVRRFEEDGRSFVHPSADGRPDDPRVDISHESLIRQWDRLRQWVDDERRSRDRYRELVARARTHERGEAALLQNPELRMVTDWRDQSAPSRSWAERYTETGGDFESAVTYLGESVQAQCHTLAEAELVRRWKIWNPIILLLVMTVAVLSESWFGGPAATRPAESGAGRAIESQPGPSAATVGTVRVDGLDWTTDDRQGAVDWDTAQAYCDRLIVGSRSDWRLPTTSELLDIYDPGEATTAGLKLKKPFHAGVTASLIWSDEPGDAPASMMAADFKAGLFVPIPVGFAAGARALCVASPMPTGRAEGIASRWDDAFRALTRYLPLGVFVLAYLMLAWAGKRLHRRLAFPRILGSFVAAGGRDPHEVTASDAERQEAVVAHGTVYASTVRRVAGYWIDMALYLVAAFVVFAVAVIAQDTPVVVTLPSGARVEGLLERTDETTVWLTTADGRERSFPLHRDPTIEITGGIPVAATLPSGEPVQGRSFEQLHVIVTLPSLEQLEGTLDRRDDTSVSLTTADGTRRSFPLNPDKPQVDIAYPPSDTGMIWILVALVVLGWLYEVLQITSMKQATLGMRAVGIFRTDLYGDRLSFARASAWYGYRLLSYLAYLLGFASQPFTKRRQTFHDWMAGSVVLRRAAKRPSG